MAEETHKVFVYGTLMRGGRNAHLLDGATLLDNNTITADASFLMEQFNSSSSPGKHTPGVWKNGQHYIKGEIWEVDKKTLAKLDELEGFDPKQPIKDNHYIREEIKMQDSSTAWIYIINADTKDAILKPHNRIIHDKEHNTQSWRIS